LYKTSLNSLCSVMRYVLICFFTLSASVTFAQQYNFRNFSIEDGLEQNLINTIYQDKNGYIWIGGNGGLTRFDGKNFKTWTTKDSLPAANILAITEDSRGVLWISCANAGVASFDGKSFTRYTEVNGLVSNDVRAIFEDSKQNLWFGTFAGVTKFTNGKFENLELNNGSAGNFIYSICEDKKGNLWLGSYGGGLGKYDGKSVVFFKTTDGLADNYVTNVDINSKGELVASTTSGISIFDGKKFSNIGQQQGLLSFQLNDFVYDGSENLWLASDYGITKYDGKTFSHITEKVGIPDNKVNCVFVDREDNLWLGTKKGLAKLADRSFVHFAEPGFSPAEIFKTSAGKIIAANRGGGIYIFNGNNFTKWEIDETLNERVISCIAEDKQGKLWFGTSDFEGVYVFDGKKTMQYTEDVGLPSNNINDIICDRKGKIWIATPNGVAKSDSSGFAKIEISEDVTDNNIVSLMEDNSGNIWMGAFDGMIYSYDGKRIQKFEENKSPVLSIIQSKNGTIFFRTEENGFLAFSENKFTSFIQKDGLSSDVVRSLVFDNNGMLWAGTQRGINKISFDSENKIRVRTYGFSEGFRSLECNSNAALFDNDGHLWFGTAKGITQFTQSEEKVNTKAPEMVVNDILLFFKQFDKGKYSERIDSVSGLPINMKLPYNENYLLFSFSAISHKNPDKVFYQWMLKGSDKDWMPETKISEANYSNLAPGDYTFIVRGCNDEKVWSEPIEIHFIITPPFYRTWWFYTVVAVFLITSTVVYVKWRERKLLREKAELEEKVTERTHQLQEQKEIVEEQNRHITEGINYARNIQMAILPSGEEINKVFPEHFILYRPKEIVGGDFYWLFRHGDYVFVAAVDCTGHGVAGAFMSMIGTDLLNQIIIEKQVTEPSEILRELNLGIKLAFKQSAREFETQQGMDVAICSINLKNNEINFSGALRPLYIISNGEFKEVEGDKSSISGTSDTSYRYTANKLKLKTGDCIYLFSDGYADQFGGPKGKKFMTGKMKQLLIGNNALTMDEQRKKLLAAHEEWKGDYKQVDDILIMGIRL
jgi:ligand-binding sensor domain-containing protein/serine phosphatase RsbU (regulator of sigma subunit)